MQVERSTYDDQARAQIVTAQRRRRRATRRRGSAALIPGGDTWTSPDRLKRRLTVDRVRDDVRTASPAARGYWGIFPLYWPLLQPAGALEILAHRVLWSLVTVLLVVLVLRRTRDGAAVFADRRTRLLLLVAAVVISVNWGGYIWGVNNDRVVETSLGYFINPLVTVMMGVLVIGERLRRLQW